METQEKDQNLTVKEKFAKAITFIDNHDLSLFYSITVQSDNYNDKICIRLQGHANSDTIGFAETIGIQVFMIRLKGVFITGSVDIDENIKVGVTLDFPEKQVVKL